MQQPYSTMPQIDRIAAVRLSLEAAGVEFIEQNGSGPGVRLRSQSAG